MRIPSTPSFHAARARPRLPHLWVVASALVLSTVPAWAQSSSPEPPSQQIEVRAESLVPRDAKTLGDLTEAVALFQRLQALAPQAELRFRALTRLDRSKADRLQIQVLAPGGRIDVPLDELSRFAFDPAWRALPPQTLVRSKLRDGEVAWRSDVRTPGLPPNTRRLGDLRLQCKLDWGTPLARRGLTPTGTTLSSLATLCETRFTGSLNSQFADRPVLAIDLVLGQRRERLSYFFLHGSGDNMPTRVISSALDWAHDLKDHMYRLPLADKSWPDDTLLELTFIDPSALPLAEGLP